MGKNSQFHLVLETSRLNKLKEEAKDLGISVSELIRRKLANPATEEEIIILRKIKNLIRRRRIDRT